jgi:hypothetical protein
VSWRLAHEAKASDVAWLVLDLLILLWAGGVITGEVKVAEGSTHLRHHLLELLLLLLVPEAVLLLVITPTVIILLGLVILVGGVELLPLGVVGDEVSGVAALKEPLGDLLLSLRNLWKMRYFLASWAISSSRMLSYCSSEATDKEDETNSKADETVVLASWAPTWALVIKDLLVREASWFGWPFPDSSWDLSLLNNFFISRVAKSVDSSMAVIFIPHTWSSRA